MNWQTLAASRWAAATECFGFPVCPGGFSGAQADFIPRSLSLFLSCLWPQVFRKRDIRSRRLVPVVSRGTVETTIQTVSQPFRVIQWQVRNCGIVQPVRRKSHPPLLRSIDISAAQGSLLLYLVPPDIRTSKRLLPSGLVLCYFLFFFCPTNRKTTTVPKGTSLCLSFHTDACMHLQSLCACKIACLSTTKGPNRSFMLATSLLKMICKPLHTPWSVCCSKVFALSSDHCPMAGILERCLLLASIPRPASILDKRCAWWSMRVLGGAAACCCGCGCPASASTSHGRALLCPANCASIEINKNSHRPRCWYGFSFLLLCTGSKWPVGQTLPLTELQQNSSDSVMRLEDDAEEQNDENVGDSCKRVTWHQRLTMTVLRKQDCTQYQLEPHACVHTCEVCTEKNARVWWDVLFSLPVASLVVYHLKKDCSKNARTITFVLPVIPSFIEGMLIFVSTNLVLPRVVFAIRSMVDVQSMNPTMRRSWIFLTISSG